MAYYRRSTIFEWMKIKKRSGNAFCCFCTIDIEAGEEVMRRPSKDTYAHIKCYEKVKKKIETGKFVI